MLSWKVDEYSATFSVGCNALDWIEKRLCNIVWTSRENNGRQYDHYVEKIWMWTNMYLVCIRNTSFYDGDIIEMCQVHLLKISIPINFSTFFLQWKLFRWPKIPILTIIFFFLCSYFLSQIKNQRYQERRREMMTRMEKFLTITTCRRAEILSHFTSRPPGNTPKSDCCDNCTRMWVISWEGWKEMG